jgi:hypothetical protein
MQLQVNVKLSAVEDKAISNSHWVNQSPPQLFYCFVLRDFSEIDAKHKLVKIYHMSLVSEEDLALSCVVKYDLVLLSIFQRCFEFNI